MWSCRNRSEWGALVVVRRFVLMVNKQGQTRLAQYYEPLPHAERRALEGEIVRKCLSRSDSQVQSCGGNSQGSGHAKSALDSRP